MYVEYTYDLKIYIFMLNKGITYIDFNKLLKCEDIYIYILIITAGKLSKVYVQYL